VITIIFYRRGLPLLSGAECDILLSATNRLGSSRWVKSPASVRIVAQHASVAVPRSRPHLCGGVVTEPIIAAAAGTGHVSLGDDSWT
jgi:hypothetical protein